MDRHDRRRAEALCVAPLSLSTLSELAKELDADCTSPLPLSLALVDLGRPPSRPSPSFSPPRSACRSRDHDRRGHSQARLPLHSLGEDDPGRHRRREVEAERARRARGGEERVRLYRVADRDNSVPFVHAVTQQRARCTLASEPLDFTSQLFAPSLRPLCAAPSKDCPLAITEAFISLARAALA